MRLAKKHELGMVSEKAVERLLCGGSTDTSDKVRFQGRTESAPEGDSRV